MFTGELTDTDKIGAYERLTSDSDYIRSVLQTIKGPIVLVGHSYNGAVIRNAALGVPNVKALAYIAAFAPEQGDTLAALVGPPAPGAFGNRVGDASGELTHRT